MEKTAKIGEAMDRLMDCQEKLDVYGELIHTNHEADPERIYPGLYLAVKENREALEALWGIVFPRGAEKPGLAAAGAEDAAS